jgi:hypothetical protein
VQGKIKDEGGGMRDEQETTNAATMKGELKELALHSSLPRS